MGNRIERLRLTWPEIALGSTVAALLLTLLGAAQTLVANWSEVGIDFSDLVTSLGPIAAGLAVALGLVTVLATVLIGTRGVALLTVLVLGLWIQHNFFAWDYGTFDGSPIFWDEHAVKGKFEVAVWLCLIAAGLAVHRLIARHAKMIVLVVLCLEMINLAVAVSGRWPLPQRADVRTTAALTDASPEQAKSAVDSVMSFSKELNVIVIVLDMFQSDFFPAAMKDPELAAAMPPGFVYYRNSVSVYPSTRFSLPSIVTSRSLLDPNQKAIPWLRETMRESVPNRLAAIGYDSTILSMDPGHLACHFDTYDYRCFDHPQFVTLLHRLREQASDSPLIARPWDVGIILSTSVFRFTPHYLKPWLYNGGAWRLPDAIFGGAALTDHDQRLFEMQRLDFEVMQALHEQVTSNSEKPTFKFLHFFTPHRPHGVNARCAFNGVAHDSETQRRQPMKERRRDAVGQSVCILSKLYELLDRLDRIGAYDPSLIFVLGDHGNSNVRVDVALADPPIAEELRPQADVPRNPETNKPVLRTSRAVPLFMAKRPFERSPLSVSDAPVSLCDVPKSIFSVLGLPEDYDCVSVFDSPEKRPQRRHYEYAGKNKDKGPTYEFDTFEVRQHSWYPGSWQYAPEAHVHSAAD